MLPLYDYVIIQQKKYKTTTNIYNNVFDIARKGVIFKDEADIYGTGWSRKNQTET